MKILFFIILSLFSRFSLSCDELLQRFEDDCILQDRSHDIKEKFKAIGIDFKKISGARALRFIDRKSWENFIAKGGTDPAQVYQPAPETWNLWNSGLEYASSNQLDIGKHPLTLEFIQQLHRVSMSDKKLYSFGAYFLKGARPGKIRSHWFIRPPEFWFKCEDHHSEEVKNLLLNYDLKDSDGVSLLSSSISSCADGSSFKGHVKYMASHKVKEEFNRWIESYNLWVTDYLKGVSLLSPTQAAADLQRWYVSIHPFGDGNGRTSRYLQDLLLDFVGIVPPLSSDLSLDLFTNKKAYRENFKKSVETALNLLEKCLQQHQNKNIMTECQVLP